MLQELFTYATAQCLPFARRMGYLYEAIAMKARYARNSSAWGPHCEKTRQFVLSGASKCRNRERIIILGSGILADVPLEELSALFKEVVLIDVVFLPAVVKAIRAFENVRMLELDVTGTTEILCRNIRSRMSTLPDSLPFPALVNESDLVVSLNILSQLPVIPERYAVRKMPGIAEEHVRTWCGTIISSHWKALAALPCPVCLVTDTGYVKRDRRGSIIEKGDTLRGCALPSPHETWTWEVAPLGELSRNFSMELTVGAWHMR